MTHLRTAAESGPRGVADVVNVSTVAAPPARSGLYDASEFAVGALTESLRADAGNRHLRVGVVRLAAPPAALDALLAAEIADAVLYMVTRPRHAAIGEIVVRPTHHEP